jgi:hypothetical protein
MKSSLSLKGLALVLLAGSIAFAAPAKAGDDYDDGDGREAVVGIIGQVITGAIEAEQAKEQAAACGNWQNKCEAGKSWACEKFEANCGGEGDSD